MTLVMDGVRRSGGVSAAMTAGLTMAPRAAAKPQMKPLSAATQRSTAGVRYMTGIDGIRRPVAMPSPRTVLENLAVPAASPMLPGAELAAMLPIPQTAVRRIWGTRPAVAFGLVATAILAAGGTTYALSTLPATTAHAAQKAPVPKVPASPGAPAVAATPARQAELQQLVDTFVAKQPAGTFGIVVKDLSTGATATSDANHVLTSASLYKLFVAQQIYRMIDTGQLSYGSPAGGDTGRNVEDCLRIMINISDNDCGRALGDIIGWNNQDAALHNAGYADTTLAQPQQTSARDVAKLLERLYTGTLNSPNSNDRFLGLLKDQRVNDRLPVGLPNGTVIAHKTGDLDGYVHDAGIVYGAKTNYLVVVTSGPWSSPGNAPAQFADLSSQLWNFFEN